MKLSQVLCAFDLSKPSQAAFSHALALSRKSDADLAVVMAVPANEPFSLQVRERTTQIASLRRASQQAGVRMSVSVQQGDPVEIILLHANVVGCDLIVLGTHDQSDDDLCEGSMAAQVTSRAVCPVLVVPVPADGTDRHFDGFFGNVVCPVDFSERSTAALEQALRVVDKPTGRLTLVHVLPNPHPMSRCADHVADADYGPLLKRDAWQRLQECVPLELRATIDLRARVVSGVQAEQIVRVSREIDADLIVMGVMARSADGQRLLGSTPVRVMRSAGRPILAIPERMHEAAIFNTESDAVRTFAA